MYTMDTYSCCQTKTSTSGFEYNKCFNSYHKWCLIRNHILVCCSEEVSEITQDDENNIVAQIICDVVSESKAKDKYLERLSRDKETNIQEALRLEEELLKQITEQQSIIKLLELELNELKEKHLAQNERTNHCYIYKKKTNVYKYEASLWKQKHKLNVINSISLSNQS